MITEVILVLDLKTYMTALHDLGLTYNTLAANFDVSNGTISNWINGTVRADFRVPVDKLLQGTKGCLQETGKDPDEFILALVEKLQITEREKSFLHTSYDRMGFDSFIPYLVHLALDQTEFVPSVYDYEAGSLLRPVVGVGQDHVLAVASNGHVRSTGLNDEQQCNTHSWRDVVSVTGCWKGSIGLHADGTCVAAGLNVIENGDLFRWTNIATLAAGAFHVIGLKTDGSVVSFGRNPFGQCNVTAWKNIKGIAAGNNHSVGLLDDGTVIASGKNDRGQCDVNDWKGVKQIVAAADHTIALLTDGTVIGCGNLGTMRLDALKDSTAIATGEQHAVGLMENGCVVNTGADVAGLSDVERWHDMIAISAGFATTIGVRADGRVFVTRDKHKSFFLDTGSWKLFENSEAGQMQSRFDSALEEYKQKLLAAKTQAFKVSPFISQYHENIKILDFSLFPAEYEKLKSMSADIYRMYAASASMPTIHNLVEMYLSAFCEMNNTIEEKDGKPRITEGTYEPFMDLLFTLNTLEPEVRMIEEGMSFPELAEQQVSDFAPLLGKVPTWK